MMAAALIAGLTLASSAAAQPGPRGGPGGGPRGSGGGPDLQQLKDEVAKLTAQLQELQAERKGRPERPMPKAERSDDRPGPKGAPKFDRPVPKESPRGPGGFGPGMSGFRGPGPMGGGPRGFGGSGSGSSDFARRIDRIIEELEQLKRDLPRPKR
jgi:hypothetical protein